MERRQLQGVLARTPIFVLLQVPGGPPERRGRVLELRLLQGERARGRGRQRGRAPAPGLGSDRSVRRTVAIRVIDIRVFETLYSV